ncbi:reverse transcriptase domain-containing protein [Tanacetum coccineum]
MPFGLRNVRATYQRLVDQAFHKQISRNLEVYVDDLVIKSLTEDEIIRDIEETFKTLREINMKLNPKKCTFGVEEGMFLGYKVNTKGIKVCPDKVDAVLSLPSPKCLKDVQKLNGKLASLNRPRLSVKGQILADFIVKRSEEDSPDTPMEVEEELPQPWILFEATNNEVEYEALIAGLRIAEQMGVKTSRQMWIPDCFAHLSKQVLVEGLKEKSINELEVLTVVKEDGDTWMTTIYEYLTEETLLVDVNKARAVRRKSQQFAVINGVLYKKSYLGTRSIVAKVLRTGYYWPTMHKDAWALIRACQDCHVHRPVPKNPQQKLTLITSPWPF